MVKSPLRGFKSAYGLEILKVRMVTVNATTEILHQRSFEFALRMVKLASFLSNEKQDWVFSRQVLRSGTSIGANIRESRFAQSKADFASKLSIALKEAAETQYWLELLFGAKLLSQTQYLSLKSDIDFLVGTLVNVVKSTKRKSSRGNLKPRSGDLTI